MTAETRKLQFVRTFYFFKTIAERPLHAIKEAILQSGESLGIRGLFILGPEGLNCTCTANTVSQMNAFTNWVRDYFALPDLEAKDSWSDCEPFAKLKVKIRDEICTLKEDDAKNLEIATTTHMSPENWDAELSGDGGGGRDFVLVDTRNEYEYRIGTFAGAINPHIEQFSDFPDFFNNQGYKKDQKILMFCTGGIRCEKAVVALRHQGYSNVHQLEGGILAYLARFPDRQFKGECFVFDNRVAVDQKLQPTKKYKLCPHCGQAAEIEITCIRCDTEALVCPDCLEVEIKGQTCSKNCAHHYALNPKKGRRQVPSWQAPVVSTLLASEAPTTIQKA